MTGRNCITICIDFDGVISTYDGYKGKDVFGKPIPETINLIRELRKEGYKIVIWTTRYATPKLKGWLKDNKVEYDALNDHVEKLPNTSHKPVYDCVIDDRAVNFNWKTNRLTKKQLRKEVENVLKGHGKLLR